MSRWGNRTDEEQQKIDFATILNDKKNASELLQIKNFVQEVKYKSSKFTQKLMEEEHRSLLHSFIDIALNPLAFMKDNDMVVDKTMTYGAIEVLSNLSQEFIQAVFDSHHGQEDEVVQTELEYPILIYIFRVLDQQVVEQTGLAYLNKLITPFIYQRPQQIIRIINSSTIQLFYRHYWNKSVGELFTKLLEAQTQKDFYQQQKIQIVQRLCTLLKFQKQQSKFLKNIQNFYDLIQFLQQKHEDKYDKGKFASLIKKIVQNINNFQFLIQKLQEYNSNKQIKIQLLKCLQAYLHIHQTKIVSKLSDQNETKSQAFRLQEAFTNKLVKYLQTHGLDQYCSDLRLQILYYYRIVKTFLNIEPGFILNIVNKRFVQETIKIMENNPNNNILHNFQRQAIVKAISQCSDIGQLLVNELSFFTRLSTNISEKNSKTCLQNQLFLIGEALKTKENCNQNGIWNDLFQKIKLKRQFYSVEIGGNPRNQEQKWDNFQVQMILPDQNEKYSQQKQIKQTATVQKIQMVQMSAGLDDLGGTQVLSEQQQEDPFDSNPKSKQKTNHFFDDLQLPLDSDEQKKQDKSLEQQKKGLDAQFIIKIQSKQQRILLNQEMVELDKVDTNYQKSYSSSYQSSSFDYMSMNKNIISIQADPDLIQPLSQRSQSNVAIHLDNYNIVDFKVKTSQEDLGTSSPEIPEFQQIDRSNSIVKDQTVQKVIDLMRQADKEEEEEQLTVSKQSQEQYPVMEIKVSETSQEMKILMSEQQELQISQGSSQCLQMKIPTLEQVSFPSISSSSEGMTKTQSSTSQVAHKDELHQILASKYGITLTANTQ